jgi:hypothetical protein
MLGKIDLEALAKLYKALMKRDEIAVKLWEDDDGSFCYALTNFAVVEDRQGFAREIRQIVLEVSIDKGDYVKQAMGDIIFDEYQSIKFLPDFVGKVIISMLAIILDLQSEEEEGVNV